MVLLVNVVEQERRGFGVMGAGNMSMSSDGSSCFRMLMMLVVRVLEGGQDSGGESRVPGVVMEDEGMVLRTV